MSYLKTAAVAALVSATALGASLTAANAGGKHHHNNHLFHNHGLGATIVIGGGSNYGCKHWLRKYKKTGKEFVLDRYYSCLYY
jgi:hypothetical protein